MAKRAKKQTPRINDGVSDDPVDDEDDLVDLVDVEDDSNLDADEEEELGDEFSLEDLSQAYAGVLDEQQESTDESGREKGQTKSRRGKLVADKIADGADDQAEPDRDSDDEVDDDAACPISPESIVESILFVGVPRGQKLTSRTIAAVLRDVSPKEVTKITKSLNARYESEDAAYRIVTEKNGSIKLEIADDLNHFQNEYYGRNRQIQLAQTAIDVLAIIAYKQPVTNQEIEKTRGKSTGGVLNQLVRRKLISVEVSGTKPKVKRYSTTERFLDLFQLDGLNDLPQSHDVAMIDDFAD
jgi:segregation and condensation protein B